MSSTTLGHLCVCVCERNGGGREKRGGRGPRVSRKVRCNHLRRLQKFGTDTGVTKFADVSYYPIDRNLVYWFNLLLNRHTRFIPYIRGWISLAALYYYTIRYFWRCIVSDTVEIVVATFPVYFTLPVFRKLNIQFFYIHAFRERSKNRLYIGKNSIAIFSHNIFNLYPSITSTNSCSIQLDIYFLLYQ